MELNPSLVSRLDQQRVDSTSLAKILQFFSGNRPVFVELLRAHLWDEIIRAGADPEVFWDDVANGDFGWLSTLSPSLQGDLQLVGTQAREVPGIRLAVEGLASAIMRSLAEVADASLGISAERKAALRSYSIPRSEVVNVHITAKRTRKNAGAPSARPDFPAKSKAS